MTTTFTSLIPFIQTAGYLGVFAMIFSETGLLFGFIFPGDTLILAAGFLASRGLFNIWTILLVIFIAAVSGDSVGYWIGKKIGPKIFTKEESRFFKRHYIVQAQNFYDKHGKKTIFLSRFIPIVRTFAPVVAGIGEMKYKTFFFYNLLGGLVWCLSFGLLGYYVGLKVTDFDEYIIGIVVGIFVLSFLPIIRQYLISRKKKRE